MRLPILTFTFFCLDNGEHFTQNWLEDIIKTPTLDIPRTSSQSAVSGNQKQIYINKLDTLNIKIQALLTEIQGSANTFIKEHFFKGEEVIRVELNFEKKFNFDLVKSKIWQEDKQSFRHEKFKLSFLLKSMKPVQNHIGNP